MKPYPLRVPDTVLCTCVAKGKSGMDAFLTGHDSAEEKGKVSIMLVGHKAHDFMVGRTYQICFLELEAAGELSL
jgi:hypothetical protein